MFQFNSCQIVWTPWFRECRIFPPFNKYMLFSHHSPHFISPRVSWTQRLQHFFPLLMPLYHISRAPLVCMKLPRAMKARHSLLWDLSIVCPWNWKEKLLSEDMNVLLESKERLLGIWIWLSQWGSRCTTGWQVLLCDAMKSALPIDTALTLKCCEALR